MDVTPVEDDEWLYRRIPDADLYYTFAGGKVTVSASAFNDRSSEPSVDRASMLEGDPSRSQNDGADGVVKLLTKSVRSIGTVVQNDKNGNPVTQYSIDVTHKPVPAGQPGGPNPAHAVIHGKPAIEPTNVFRRLREALSRMIEPTDWCILPARARGQEPNP